MKKFLFILICTIILQSCSNLQSGRYIQLDKNETVDSLAKKNKTATWEIIEANPGKSLQKGAWVFIPEKKGLSSHFHSGRVPTSMSPKATQKFYEDTDFAWPVPSSRRVSSKFGRRWGKGHQGIDIAAKGGTSIVSIDDGVVVYSGRGLGGYGNLTVISHDNGFFSVYAHARKNFTRKGERVYRNQVIALVGKTGRSTGNHLHFELRRNSTAIDPLKVLARK